MQPNLKLSSDICLSPLQWTDKQKSKFGELIAHWPENKKKNINFLIQPKEPSSFLWYYQTVAVSEFVNNIKSKKNLTDLDPERATHLSIRACYKGLITVSELVTVQLQLGAIHELVKNPKICGNMVRNDGTTDTFINYLNLPDIKVHIFDNLTESDHTINGESEIELKIPLLKNYFWLTVKEWEQFQADMNKKSSIKRQWLLIQELDLGCWSPMMDRIRTVFKCFQSQILQVKHQPTGQCYQQHFVVIPSYSMIKTFLKIKTMQTGRTPVKLKPSWAKFTEDDIFALRLQNSHPLGLWYPPDGYSLKVIDGHFGTGPFPFALHEIAHAARLQEMTDAHANAVNYMVKILKEKRKSAKDSLKIEQISSVISPLIDGELIHSFKPYPESIFVSKKTIDKNGQDIFGTIFQNREIGWTDELKRYVIADMVMNREIWQKEFGLNERDLLEEEMDIHCGIFQNTYIDPLISMFVEKYPSSNDVVEDKTLETLEFPDHEFVFIKSCSIKNLTGHNFVIFNSEIDTLKISGTVYYAYSSMDGFIYDTENSKVFRISPNGITMELYPNPENRSLFMTTNPRE